MGHLFIGVFGKRADGTVIPVNVYYDAEVETAADVVKQAEDTVKELGYTLLQAGELSLGANGAVASNGGANGQRNSEDIQPVKVHSVLRRVQKTEDRETGEIKKVIALDFYPEWNQKRDFGLFAYSFYMDNGDADRARVEKALGFDIDTLPISNQKAATQRDPKTWDATIKDDDEFEKLLDQPITIYVKTFQVKAKDKQGQFILAEDGTNVMQKRTKFAHFEGEA